MIRAYQGRVQGGAKGHNRTPKQIDGGAIAPPGRSPPLFQAAPPRFFNLYNP